MLSTVPTSTARLGRSIRGVGVLCGLAASLLICALAFGEGASSKASQKSAAFAEATSEGYVPREGFTLHYRTIGSGAPLLLLSGGPGFEVDYLTGIAQELGSSSQCILLEQRGTGRSQPPNPTPAQMTLKLFVEDIEALRSSLKIERLRILGHSWGGMLAMAYAAAYPDHVDSLVLVDSGGMDLTFAANFSDNLKDRASMREREDLDKAEAAVEHATDTDSSESASAAYNRLITPFYFYDRTLAAKLFALQPGNPNQHRVSLLLFDDLAKNYHVRSGMKTFPRPVLIIQGRQDPMPETVAIEIHEVVRNSQIVFIDRSGHFPWIEQPKPFFKAVRVFLEEHR